MQHIKQNHTYEKRVDGFKIQTKQSLMQAKQINRYLQIISNDALFNQKIWTTYLDKGIRSSVRSEKFAFYTEEKGKLSFLVKNHNLTFSNILSSLKNWPFYPSLNKCMLIGSFTLSTVRLLTHVLCKPTHFFFHSFIATRSYSLQTSFNSVLKDWADKYHVWGTPTRSPSRSNSR